MTRGAQMPDNPDLLAAEDTLGLLDEDAWLEAERQLASDTLFRAEYQRWSAFGTEWVGALEPVSKRGDPFERVVRRLPGNDHVFPGARSGGR